MNHVKSGLVIGIMILGGCVVHERPYRREVVVTPLPPPPPPAVVVEPEPAPLVEVVPVAPGPDYVWVRGRYYHDHGRWVWHRGYYDRRHW